MLEIGFAQDPSSKGAFKPYDDDYYIHYADSIRYGVIHRRSLKKTQSTTGGEDSQRSGWTREIEGGYVNEPISEEGLRELLGESPTHTAGYNFGRAGY